MEREEIRHGRLTVGVLEIFEFTAVKPGGVEFAGSEFYWEHASAPVGQVTRHHIVVRPAGELPQARAVDVHFVDVIEGLVAIVVELKRIVLGAGRFDKGKDDPPCVPRESWLEHVAAGELAAEE